MVEQLIFLASRATLIEPSAIAARQRHIERYSHHLNTSPLIPGCLLATDNSLDKMSFRPGFRSSLGSSTFQTFRNTFRQTLGRRWQSVTADATQTVDNAAAKVQKEKLNPFAWNSPVGPKTVHFWFVVILLLNSSKLTLL